MLSRCIVLGLLLLGGGVAAGEAPPVQGRFEADGTALVLRLEDGRVLRGQDLVGASLVLGDEAREIEVRIDGFEEDRAILREPLALYRLSVLDEAGAEARDLCEPDPDGRRAAFAFPGKDGGFNLTCTSGAEGKCVLLGYRPWQEREGWPLGDLYRACIHMLRADYAGDDRPMTRNGTRINIFDRFGIQNPGSAPGMAFEAAWGRVGAVCVAHPRVPDLVTLDDLARRHPGLAGHLGPERCTEAAMRADPRALIFNESTPP